MSQNFDWEFYLVYYPDLKKNGLATQKQALWHYNRYGKKEGRIGNKNEVDAAFNSTYAELKKRITHLLDQCPDASNIGGLAQQICSSEDNS
mgnify:CR=1 FL=1